MLRPWELAAAGGARPWEQDELVYPRTISIFRLTPASDSLAGPTPLNYQEAQASSGTLVWASSPIFSGIPCSIQEETRGKDSPVNLPGSAIVPLFRVYIPLAALAKGSVNAHDYVQDEIGAQYVVTDPYWDSLGYRLFCQLSEP